MAVEEETVRSVLQQDGTKPTEKAIIPEKKVISEAANKVDKVDGILKETGDEEPELNPQKRHFDAAEAPEETSEPPQKRHFPDQGTETTSDAEKLSIKLVEKPEDHGNFIAVEDAPTDLAKTTKPSKRIFPQSEAMDEEPRKVRKVIDDAANKKDTVFETEGDDAPVPSRKHFDNVGNNDDHIAQILVSEEKDDAPIEKPTNDKPAGLSSADINEPPKTGHTASHAADAKAKAMSGTSMANCLAWPESK